MSPVAFRGSLSKDQSNKQAQQIEHQVKSGNLDILRYFYKAIISAQDSSIKTDKPGVSPETIKVVL